MKKYLIGFGLAVIFFAGNSHANFPEFTAATNFKDCKYGKVKTADAKAITEKGAWINAPLFRSEKSKLQCLKTGELVVKKKGETAPAGACDGLGFNSVQNGIIGNKIIAITESEVSGKYLVPKGNVKCEENGKCVIDKVKVKEENIPVTCYKDAEAVDGKDISEIKIFKTKSKEPTDFCVVEYKYLRIKEIDYPRNKDEQTNSEWYCPYSWSESYPEGINPYNSLGDYFKNSLSPDVYNYLPEDDELKKDCSVRMFALSKACLVNTQKKSKIRENISKIKKDFYTKGEVLIARAIILKEAGIPALNHWNQIKDLSFDKICNLQQDSNGNDSKCKEIDAKKETPVKKKALELVHTWLKTNKDLRKSTKTPQEFIKDSLKKIWNTDKINGVNQTISGFSQKAGSLSADDIKTLLMGTIVEIWGASGTDNNENKKLKNAIGRIYKDADFKFETIGNWGEMNGKNASDEFSKLTQKAITAEKSAKLVSKYISRRNMDLNVSVSVAQTSHIEVSKILQVIGGKDGSKESKLTLFNTNEGDINIVDKIIRLAVRTMGTLAILLLIISGVLMVVSQGDENQLAKAKSTFLYTLIGLFVGFLSYTIVRFIIDTLLS